MRKVHYTFLLLVGCLLGVLPSYALKTENASGFRDIELNLMNGNFLTADEITNQTTVSFGVAIAEDGTATRVAADDASANVVLQNFKFHSDDHGFNPGTFIVPVKGSVKISYGTCAWGGDVAVKDASGSTVATFTTKLEGKCYHNDQTVVEAFYVGEATTLSLSGGSYISYVAIEVLDNEPDQATITFELGAYADAGKVPESTKDIVGTKFTFPLNRQLYVEGKTLTAWTDGTTEYKLGEEITLDADLTVTPVFTDNTVALADRTEEVTITWDFQRKNGAPLLAYEGSLGFYVSQAVVNGQSIDVKIDFDTNNGGKLANANWTDWAQMNNGTKFTLPVAKNSVVKLESYSPTTTTTIAGSTDYTLSGGVATYVYGGTNPTIDIVIGDGSYFRYFTITYPVAESNLQERKVIDTDFTSWQALSSNNAPVDVKVNTTFSSEEIIFTFDGVTVAPGGVNADKFGDLVGWAMAEKSKAGTITTSAIGNVTKVSFLHGATGGNRGYKLEKKSATDADWVLLSDAVADPATGKWVTCDVNESDVQLRWTNLNLPQNAYMFNLEIYSKVEILAPQVTLEMKATPEEGGKVFVSPESEQYDEGSEVTLKAVKNFGYQFVKWIDGTGATLSTEAVYKHILDTDAVITGVFEPIATYVLTTFAEGGANNYMVTATPVPTVVDGKKMYEVGTLVTLTATENPIMTFLNWTTGATTKEITVTMDEDKEFTAVYGASDYIVGWDFVLKGSDTRLADFISDTENEATALILRNAAGVTQGWLDKSTEAANGYEGEPAAVNWKPLVDKYYYETKIDASNFKNIKVTSRMLYNYNAYKVQKLEYSLDGTEYHTVAAVALPGGKVWTPVEASLPAVCDNASMLYLRWIPDYESDVVGSASANDGTAIGSIYVTGTLEGIDPGTEPKLLSILPVNNAEEASATGRIVLNFDRKVQVAEGTIATLGGKELTPVVAGSTITFPYIGLEYNKAYTFTLPANTVHDAFDNTLTKAITTQFTTMNPPVVTPGMYDAVVTDATELLAALADANASASSGARYRIFLHDGVYDLGEKCLTEVKSNISLIGESMENTIIMNEAPAEGIGVSATLLATGENIYMQDLTLKNAYDFFALGGDGRAVCLQDKGNKNVFKNVRMLSYQDTYYSNNNRMRSYFEDGAIHGKTDFICGGGDVFFNRTLIYMECEGGVITAPAGDTDWGYVFNDCVIDGNPGTSGSFALGRPWQGTPMSVWINTKMKTIPEKAGWREMNDNVLPKLFAEYNSHTESGNPVDCSLRKTVFKAGTVTYGPVLTKEEAARFTVENALSGSDAWQPVLLTEQAIAPVITIKDGAISWNASDYVFCYAICKNGKVIDFTNDNTYTLPIDADDDDEFTVRAANEMGGLGVASNTGTITGIEDVVVGKEVVDRQYYTFTGIRIPKAQKGLNIVRIVYSDGTVQTVKEYVK